MKIKVCGLREPDNIRAVAALRPDYLGFIFHEASPRHAAGLPPSALEGLPAGIQKVGVFVNAPVAGLLRTAARYGLDVLQLHGDEPPSYAHVLRGQGYAVFKALRIGSAADLAAAGAYEAVCDALVFDARGPHYGGNGRPFDWALLAHYGGQLPFLLGGGLRPEHAPLLQAPPHPLCMGLDLNSGFEQAPGRKDIALLHGLLQRRSAPSTGRPSQ